MAFGPTGRSRLDRKKAHAHPLTAGKKYTVTTKRDKRGTDQIACLIYTLTGSKHDVLLRVDHLKPGVTYRVSFTAAPDTSLILTHWHRKDGRWIQLNSEKKN